jgi:translation initiation factor 2 gamma subunit (eIF-2gamma)
MEAIKHVIVGTAGHIDHGKSSLVQALTGTNPDRLEEEKRRGITLDLGFAFLELDGARLGLVDVPGHERFVRNMLAGAGGIDVVLLVIAADEGIKPHISKFAACWEFRAELSQLRNPIWWMPTRWDWCAWRSRNSCANLFWRARRFCR